MITKYKIEILNSSSSTSWDEYVNSHPLVSIYHLSKWKYIIEDTFQHKCLYYYALNDEGAICGILPSVNLNSKLFGNFIVSMPFLNYGGVLADNADVAKQLNEHLEDQATSFQVSYIQYREQVERTENLLPVSTTKVNMILQLPETAEALGKLIGSKRRSQIKRPIKEGVSHKIGKTELLDDFYQVFCENMRDLGTPVYGKTFFKNILEVFAEHCTICVVYWQGKPVSSGFLITYKGRMEIPWASTLSYANRISVNMYLYWQILSHAIEAGCHEFDFGRSTIDEGTYRFKKQWKSEPQQCYWYHWVPEGGELPNLSPTNAKFDLAIKMWKKLPLPIANTLGPFLVKNLP
ncbi:FemAB family XrtA/PEP-CTERM system-associated protein [Colwellia hornerae]|uniref:FemAB family PEP-CTERM system-associated protein n=1 Tax=Colwellia hornerae TaxID=89402 RepID=A0A5C6QHZ9_9GAMM|nr:FemAB family XrtA/PEP-CTERM system-associated protein [Colwellia hornerae]TWX52483.1 FemAB family PEP-CTERM system-associated protein [Colwellia hornerae]TWX58312.1 FemAB family PEP-CTERM system-associated protein [Colwellia hornerae]TWX68343.1 FemAB family PEP-CTERM system-associated protein [Colwellia hornerae]